MVVVVFVCLIIEILVKLTRRIHWEENSVHQNSLQNAAET